MKVEQLSKLMSACGYKDYGIDKLSLLEMSLERDPNFTLEKAKEELVETLKLKDFDWVNIAIESKFVYTSNEVSPNEFRVDSLLIFTDSFRWKDIVQSDAILSFDQKEELKKQIREIGVQYFQNIYELIEHADFNWLPFEVKHAFKANFGGITYSNDDIIFYLKTIVWEYLYPHSFDSDRLNSIRDKSLLILQNQQINEGWTEMFQVMEEIKDCFPGIDLYELSRVEWDKNIQYKMHYRNPFALGFQRISYRN